MKYLMVITILAAMVLASCSKESTVVSPQQQQQVKNEWISLNHTPSSLSIESTCSASKMIDGSKGGTISLSHVFRNNGSWSLVTATLTIPKGAFTGKQLISYIVDTDCAGITLSPSQTFAKNLSLDLVFTGVDISGYDPSHLGFCYLDDGGQVIPARFTYTNANIANGLLVVLGAQINHFSRYGWGTIDGPLPDPIADGGQE